MERILRKLREELEAGRPAVLCRVIAARGSVPRGAGAAMLFVSLIMGLQAVTGL